MPRDLAAETRPPQAPRTSGPPNIVLIVADDLGYGDVGAYGSPDARTPHIDSIAHGGVRFTDFYATAPVCTPSRYALLTGRHPNREPDNALMTPLEYDVTQRGISSGVTTIAQALLERGYRTAMVGKWHLGHGGMLTHCDTSSAFHPNERGFEYFYGALSGSIDYNSHTHDEVYRDWYENTYPIAGGEAGSYATHLFTQRAVDLVGLYAAEPFFLYVPYTAPHIGNVDSDDPTVGNQLPPGEETDRRYLGRFDDLYADDASPRKRLLAMTAALDDGVGEILEALERHEVLDQTIVLLLSDNGAMPANGGSNGALRGGKRSVYEGGIRVVALMQYPARVGAGRISDQVASVMDLFPSLLRIVDGSTAPEGVDGVDLSPQWFGDAANTARDIFIANPEYGYVYRRGPWKYVVDRRGGYHKELYNVVLDPGESLELSSEDPAKLTELADLHAQHMAAVTIAASHCGATRAPSAAPALMALILALWALVTLARGRDRALRQPQRSRHCPFSEH